MALSSVHIGVHRPIIINCRPFRGHQPHPPIFSKKVEILSRFYDTLFFTHMKTFRVKSIYNKIKNWKKSAISSLEQAKYQYKSQQNCGIIMTSVENYMPPELE